MNKTLTLQTLISRTATIFNTYCIASPWIATSPTDVPFTLSRLSFNLLVLPTTAGISSRQPPLLEQKKMRNSDERQVHTVLMIYSISEQSSHGFHIVIYEAVLRRITGNFSGLGSIKMFIALLTVQNGTRFTPCSTNTTKQS